MPRKHYARQAKNKQLEVDAAEIRLRAERRLGQILKETPMNKGEAGRFTGGSLAVPPVAAPTLSDMGIDKKLSRCLLLINAYIVN